MVVGAGERPAKATRHNASEDDMNEKRDGGSPNWKLLLIPAAVILAKGAMHRRAMWEAGPTDEAGRGPGRSHGRPRRFGGWDPEAAEPAAFRLPPRMERMLDSWHTRAHGSTAATEPPAA
jgi:hypothetical protein